MASPEKPEVTVAGGDPPSDLQVEDLDVGGRRRLTIPPDLGYGSRGAGGAIGPNETLLFVVDLIGVR